MFDFKGVGICPGSFFVRKKSLMSIKMQSLRMKCEKTNRASEATHAPEVLFFSGLCQMVLMTSKTSLQKWSGVFLFPSVSPVFFQIGTVTYQHRLRFRWRGFMYEFLPLIRKARTRCDLCRALHDFARLRLTSQCLPAGNYGWRKCIQRGCLKNTSSVSF